MRNQEFMSVGEVANKMNITVRTLQYYDKEGVLKPSKQSAGGRRLYTSKDIVKLHQILSMKFLGFSLDDIKNNLISLNTSQDVLNVLSIQANSIKDNISNLSEALIAIELLQDEIIQMEKVDFHKYAQIIEQIRTKNEYYGVVKYFDDKTMNHINTKFTKESGKALIEKFQNMCETVIILKSQNETPEGIKGQEVAKEWWSTIIEFTDGDMSLLSELTNLYVNNENWSDYLKERKLIADEFIEKALFIYLQEQGIEIPEMENNQNE